MTFSKMPCANTVGEINHDVQAQKNTERWERAKAEAWDKFDNGDMDDAIYEFVADEPTAALAIALHACFPFRRAEDDDAWLNFKNMVRQVVLTEAEDLYESIHF